MIRLVPLLLVLSMELLEVSVFVADVEANEQWQPVFTDEEKTVLVDIASVTRDDPMVSFKERWLFAGDGQCYEIGRSPPLIECSELVRLMQIDCETFENRILEKVTIGLQQQVISVADYRDRDIGFLYHDDFRHAILKFACGSTFVRANMTVWSMRILTMVLFPVPAVIAVGFVVWSWCRTGKIQKAATGFWPCFLWVFVPSGLLVIIPLVLTGLLFSPLGSTFLKPIGFWFAVTVSRFYAPVAHVFGVEYFTMETLRIPHGFSGLALTACVYIAAVALFSVPVAALLAVVRRRQGPR